MPGDTQLKPIEILPGFDKNDTSYEAKGRWIDGNRVRFRTGSAEKLGGWAKLATGGENYLGTARKAITFAGLNGDKFYAVGTNAGVYLYSGGNFYDITPVRASATETSCISTFASNTTEVKVSDASHAAVVGDYVVLSSVSDSGIDIHGTMAVVSANTHNYVLALNSSSSVAESTAKINIGGSVDINYLLPTGKDSNSPQTGYGSGTYGSGVYGTGTVGALTQNMRLWSFDVWGEDLMAIYRGSEVFRWDKSDGVDVRMSVADSNIPTMNNTLVITEEARHMMLFGTSVFGGDFDPLAVRWSQSENYAVWSPAVTNAAGGFRLNSGSYIVGPLKLKKEILAFTDEGVHAIIYKGAPFFFSQERLGIACGLISPNACVDANGIAYWMSKSSLFMYDGSIKKIKTDMDNVIFEPDSDLSINYDQKEKVYAGVNSEFDEIWFFYPSRDSETNDRYFVYNYVTGEVYDGTLDRTTWVDSYLFDRPLATSTSNAAYAHEVGHDADGNEMKGVFLESGYFDIEDGQPLVFLDRVIPDVDSLSGNYMKFYVKLKKHPLETATIKGPYTVGPNTKKISLRARARQMSLQVHVSSTGSDFQLGKWRVDIAPDGER